MIKSTEARMTTQKGGRADSYWNQTWSKGSSYPFKASNPQYSQTLYFYKLFREMNARTFKAIGDLALDHCLSPKSDCHIIKAILHGSPDHNSPHIVPFITQTPQTPHSPDHQLPQPLALKVPDHHSANDGVVGDL